MADGGKRVDGVRKEKRARMPPFGVSELDSVAIWPLGCACRRDKNVKRVGKATTPRNTKMKRCGDMLECGVPNRKLDKRSCCRQQR